MRQTDTILGLIHERGKKGLPLERVQRQLYNRNLYLTAYGKIYRNKGAMTKGSTEETVDGMSLNRIEAIIKALRDGTFQWRPARRVYIPKKSGKMRPLGLPDWTDKIVQEVIRMILNGRSLWQLTQGGAGFERVDDALFVRRCKPKTMKVNGIDCQIEALPHFPC